MSTATTIPDPATLVRDLRAEDIRDRLRQLDAERVGLTALLRVVAARERALARRQGVSSAK
jgi:hypothetical protein